MKAALFCGDRSASRRVLEEMVLQGVEVVACVFEEAKPNGISEFCDKEGIPTYTYQTMGEALHDGLFPEFDWGISYLYHRILKSNIIDFAHGRIINFHPAPTGVHRGVAACCFCVLHGYKEWAVTAHYLTTGVDSGSIIAQKWFVLENITTAQEAEALTQENSIQLFKEVLQKMLAGDPLEGTPQEAFRGVYYSRADMERDKKVELTDDALIVRRKAEAFWFPPYHGAFVEIGGERFTLVSQKLLEKLQQN